MFKQKNYYLKKINKNCLLLGSCDPTTKQAECSATTRTTCENCPFFTSKKEWKKRKRVDWLTGYISYYEKRKEEKNE